LIARINAYGDSISRYGEELCGNRIEIVRGEAGVTAILADGMGGGIKANMLASLAVQMMSAMLARGEPVEKIADMIVESQPAGPEEGVGYSAFTIVQAIYSGMIFFAQMGTPDVVLLRRGKPVELQTRRTTVDGRVIRNGVSNLREVDTLVAVSSGMLRAGAGRDLKSGWTRNQIAVYMENASTPRVTAEKLARLLLSAAKSLSRGKPGDDFSALVFRVGR
jgi:hypothetical protein